jgi:hypothetical protein
VHAVFVVHEYVIGPELAANLIPGKELAGTGEE